MLKGGKQRYSFSGLPLVFIEVLKSIYYILLNLIISIIEVIRKHFFTLKMVRHWSRLPREAVESPSLETFKTQLDVTMGSLLQLALPEREPWCLATCASVW